MKRIHVYYQGVRYTIADREVADIKQEIEAALSGGTPHWLTVNHGEGTLRKVDLLIASGVGIGLMPIDPEAEDKLPAVSGVALPGDVG
jgi:hypothetical protein